MLKSMREAKFDEDPMSISQSSRDHQWASSEEGVEGTAWGWREVAERLSWHSVDSVVAVRDVTSPRAYVLDR